MTTKEAIGRIQDHIHIHSKKEPITPFLDEAFNMAIEALKAERPHGEWKVDDRIYCSECGETLCDFLPNPTDAVALILDNKFCFNCGADMRKEGEAE